MSNLLWFLDPPQSWFTLGMCVIFLAMVHTYTGRAWDRSFNHIERDKDPKGYWGWVAIDYLVGLGLIGVYLYKIHLFSK